jgi:hypothetical protein
MIVYIFVSNYCTVVGINIVKTIFVLIFNKYRFFLFLSFFPGTSRIASVRMDDYWWLCSNDIVCCTGNGPTLTKETV